MDEINMDNPINDQEDDIITYLNGLRVNNTGTLNKRNSANINFKSSSNMVQFFPY